MKKLSHTDINNTNQRYSQRYKQYGHDQKSVGWGEKGRQIERFKILLDSLKLEQQQSYKILDIGAGFGDLFHFLNESNILVESYIGYELVEDLVSKGLQAYGHNKRFQLIHDDFLDSSQVDEQQFDVTFMSGCFNFKLLDGDNYDYIFNCLKKALDASIVSITANFITNRVDYEEDYIFYADPRKIIDIVYGLSKRFTLDHSYFPFEFTVAIFKDQAYDSEYPVFNDPRISSS